MTGSAPAGAPAGSTPGGTLGLCPVISVRHPELRPSVTHRPDERPPPGAVSAASVVAFVVLGLLAISPALVLSGLFTAGVCAVAARECR